MSLSNWTWGGVGRTLAGFVFLGPMGAAAVQSWQSRVAVSGEPKDLAGFDKDEAISSLRSSINIKPDDIAIVQQGVTAAALADKTAEKLKKSEKVGEKELGELGDEGAALADVLATSHQATNKSLRAAEDESAALAKAVVRALQRTRYSLSVLVNQLQKSSHTIVANLKKNQKVELEAFRKKLEEPDTQEKIKSALAKAGGKAAGDITDAEVKAYIDQQVADKQKEQDEQLQKVTNRVREGNEAFMSGMQRETARLRLIASIQDEGLRAKYRDKIGKGSLGISVGGKFSKADVTKMLKDGAISVAPGVNLQLVNGEIRIDLTHLTAAQRGDAIQKILDVQIARGDKKLTFTATSDGPTAEKDARVLARDYARKALSAGKDPQDIEITMVVNGQNRTFKLSEADENILSKDEVKLLQERARLPARGDDDEASFAAQNSRLTAQYRAWRATAKAKKPDEPAPPGPDHSAHSGPAGGIS